MGDLLILPPSLMLGPIVQGEVRNRPLLSLTVHLDDLKYVLNCGTCMYSYDILCGWCLNIRILRLLHVTVTYSDIFLVWLSI